MADRIVETSTQGFGSRIFGSIKGVLVGLVLFVVSFPLLWWNEQRAVQTADSLTEGEQVTVSVAPDKVDPSNEGKLVHVTGNAATTEALVDPVFAVSASALRLVRTVEMFQWVEDVKEEKTKNVGGSETTTKTYSYSKKWSEKLIRSSEFKQPQDHQNPATMPYDEKDLVAASATLGAFGFPEEAIKRLTKMEELPFNPAETAKLPPELASRVQSVDGKLYMGKTPSDPGVGDVRVSFQIVKPQTVSLLAQQKGATFQAYQTKAGDKLFRVEAGAVDAQGMYKEAKSENVTLTWILRGLGFFLMTLGMTLMFKPVATVTSFIPMLGSFVGFSTFLFSLVLCSALSGITIAVAWIAARPLLGMAIFGAAAVGMTLTVVMARSARRRKRAAA